VSASDFSLRMTWLKLNFVNRVIHYEKFFVMKMTYW
jgi:hypothetical protein